jgi:ABC-type Fe3+/spermidine/putrescine transport system ATPase subunit
VKAARLSLKKVMKRFTAVSAVDDVSLDIAVGDSLVIVGPSGCGKTTLLRLIAGLEVPDGGEIWMSGAQVSGPSRTLVPPHRRNVGFVFQDLALWPHLTVRRHLEFVLESVGVPRTVRPQKVSETLTIVRIESLADRYPHQLSGGEQQRVALARAVVGAPSLILLDEPLSSLDPELRSILRAELSELQRALGLTMVYVTHDAEDAAVLADRIVEMRGGQILSITSNETKRGAR